METITLNQAYSAGIDDALGNGVTGLSGTKMYIYFAGIGYKRIPARLRAAYTAGFNDVIGYWNSRRPAAEPWPFTEGYAYLGSNPSYLRIITRHIPQTVGGV